MFIIFSLSLSFLCGAFPTGYIIGRQFKGIDIRDFGSGNIGSTNIRRVLGNKLAIVTQIIDILKSLIPMCIIAFFSSKITTTINVTNLLCFSALSSIIAHNYTPFLNFKGGKGVNTTLGALFILSPISVLTGVAIYFILRFFTEIVSIRSIALGMTIPSVAYVLHNSPIVITTCLLSSILIIIRHKDNIIRLIKGFET